MTVIAELCLLSTVRLISTHVIAPQRGVKCLEDAARSKVDLFSSTLSHNVTTLEWPKLALFSVKDFANSRSSMFVYDSSVAEVPGAPSDSERITGEANDSLANVVNDGLPNESIEEVEETLESHEVIELQAFIKRKEWIEEKIRVCPVYKIVRMTINQVAEYCKFLENLPPIEVFAGVEESLNAPEQTAGSATRSQLNDWMIEHDRIEKETEIFDSGDLKKLKKFTKGSFESTRQLYHHLLHL